MKLASRCLTVALALAFAGNVAFAQGDGGEGGEGDDLDVFMRVLPANAELPEAATREIELPRDGEDENAPFRPSEQGVNNGGEGLETANDAREDGRAFGQEAAAAAQENRENLGRGSRPDLEDLPDQVPDDIPAPPETPGGPPSQ